jgi:hypothetical protein
MSKANTPISSVVSQNRWDQKTLDSRIDPSQKFKRFEAGSPNDQEIEAYRAATIDTKNRRTAIVLGMTPEIRNLAIQLFDTIVSVDNNPISIATYSDWITKTERQREKILHVDWFELPANFTKQVSAIYGDGVFGNLPDIGNHRQLLELLSEVLEDEGRLILRKVVIPRGFDPSLENFNNYLICYRNGQSDLTEFGFATRILGHYSTCYNPDTYVLDNKKVFDNVSEMYDKSKITKEEYDAVNRYYYSGANCILPEDVWENLLDESGFSFRQFRCSGKDWYRYYKIYQCCKKR